MGPDEVEVTGSVGLDMARRKAVDLLLDDEAGKSVIITTEGPPHHGSGTTSSMRSSWSVIFALKLVTPSVTSPAPPWLRREIMQA